MLKPRSDLRSLAALAGLLLAACALPGAGPFAGGTPRVRTAYIVPAEPLSFAVGTPVPGAGANLPDPPVRDLADLARRYKLACGAQLQPVGDEPPPQVVGERREFSVYDFARHHYASRPSTLRLATATTYWYVQDGVAADAAALTGSAQAFEERIRPTTQRFFGAEPEAGPDGDRHLTVWYGAIAGAGGYVAQGDLYPRAAVPTSNARKLVLVASQGPPLGSDGFLAELAHEYQHLILGRPTTMGLWVNEGASELAMALNGFAPFPPPSAYADRPDLNLTGWAAEPALATGHYAAAYLFLSYVGQRLGGYGVMKDLLRTPGAGPNLFDAYLARAGRPERFDDLVLDWMVASYIDAPGLDGGRYAYDAAPKLKASDVVAQPAQRPATVEQFGARYLDITLPGDVNIEFQGAPGVRLFPADPHSGRAVWWSNRGDQIDSSLTRTLDLTAVGRATLRFWAWYDLEQDADYAYVSVSDDGGCTWKTLPTGSTTTRDPSGNNLGDGFTGSSGGSDSPRWVEQAADLTPWAGKKVQLRFESVTDEGYNLPGFALGGIAVPELGWADDLRSDGDWQAGGFARTGTLLPQPFGLRLIEFGPTPEGERPLAVTPVTLDANQFARVRVDGIGARLTRATLVVTGLSRHTTEVAQFRYTVRPAGG
jgi:hypothetical protein